MTASSYDEVPYESQAFAQSHPDRLATIGRLFGLHAAAVDHCRVLELGCGVGANLIPLACTMPESRFVGIDLSARHIESAQATIAALGLKNVEVHHLDLMAFDEAFGVFDYIIAHGLYSWVPETVQEHILHICRHHLAPQGIAYVSYNTYPGWHFRGMIRDMMLYHTAPLQDPAARAGQARALLDFLSLAVGTQDNAYGLMLKNEVDLLRHQRDSYLLHDHLEESNTPVYFHQFAARAAEHDLQYLGESEFALMLTGNFKSEVTETLRRVSTEIIRTEQYMDFVRNRAFRQTLLCRREVALNRTLDWQTPTSFWISSPAQPQGSGTFVVPSGGTLSTSDTLVSAAIQLLGEIWPRSLSFDTLLSDAAARSGQSASPERLGNDLMTAYTVNAVVFRTWVPGFVTEVGTRPEASPLSRHQARNSDALTNQMHETVRVDLLGRALVQVANGTRTVDEICAELVRVAQSGILNVQKDGQPLTQEAEQRAFFNAAVPPGLAGLARSALMIA